MEKEQIEILRSSARKLVRELGILEFNKGHDTPGHLHALTEIARDEGISISKLGKLLLMSISKISRMVKSLVNDGKVISKAGSDKREKYLYLSELGREEVKKIDKFSYDKIIGAREFLSDEEVSKVISGLTIYSKALERSRQKKDGVKIRRISTSRPLRKKIMNMIENIQRNEFQIQTSNDINNSILKAEDYYYHNNSYNFWYASDDEGRIIGSIGLKYINSEYAELKKLFVITEYRGNNIAQTLIEKLLEAAQKHGFKYLVLGTVSQLERAINFYKKYGFGEIDPDYLPKEFDFCHTDNFFMKLKLTKILKN